MNQEEFSKLVVKTVLEKGDTHEPVVIQEEQELIVLIEKALTRDRFQSIPFLIGDLIKAGELVICTWSNTRDAEYEFFPEQLYVIDRFIRELEKCYIPNQLMFVLLSPREIGRIGLTAPVKRLPRELIRMVAKFLY